MAGSGPGVAEAEAEAEPEPAVSDEDDEAAKGRSIEKGHKRLPSRREKHEKRKRKEKETKKKREKKVKKAKKHRDKGREVSECSSSSNRRKRPRTESPTAQASSALSASEPLESSSGTDCALPNFDLTGTLLQDTRTGSVREGIAIQYREPPEACMPPSSCNWRLYVFRGEEHLGMFVLAGRSFFLVGSNSSICDIHVQHPSVGEQHAVLQFMRVRDRDGGAGPGEGSFYLIHLCAQRGRKTMRNGQCVPPREYIKMDVRDVLRFGCSEHELVLLRDDAAKT